MPIVPASIYVLKRAISGDLLEEKGICTEDNWLPELEIEMQKDL